MRRTIAFSSMLLVAGCASAPQQAPPLQPVAAQQSRESGNLLGLTPQDLVGQFGTPALQIHEGASLKLQFRGPSCVMDAYLYPSGTAGTLKVTHIDTRLPSGSDIDQAACVSSLRRSS
jgi:hypothetical protein